MHLLKKNYEIIFSVGTPIKSNGQRFEFHFHIQYLWNYFYYQFQRRDLFEQEYRQGDTVQL